MSLPEIHLIGGTRPEAVKPPAASKGASAGETRTPARNLKRA